MPDAHDPYDVAVIGGGIVGTACAVEMQRAGMRSVLIDRSGHTGGCAAGSAGVLATTFVLPLSDIAVVLRAPAMLIRRSGPLAMHPRHLPHYSGWLTRFAINSLPSRQRTSIDGLKWLNSRALRAWNELLGREESTRLIRTRGMLDVVRAGRSVTRLHASAARLNREGMRVDALSAAEVKELEPALGERTAGGTLHADVRHVVQPRAVADALVVAFTSSGGTLAVDDVTAIEPCADHLRVRGATGQVRARRVLIAAGWWSRELLAPLGVRVPLRAERGYHVMARLDGPPLTRPVSFHEESFLATPLSDGLRLAGTVELAPPNAPPRWTRADVLADLARPYLPSVSPDLSTRWFGSRPSLPDSLPAIGALRSDPRVLYAFGHQHLGLTQAAITAQLVRDLVPGQARASAPDFSIERFT